MSLGGSRVDRAGRACWLLRERSVNRNALLEFSEHGVKSSFSPERGA